jgi:DUF2924 family protein
MVANVLRTEATVNEKTILRQLAELPILSVPELRERWRGVFETEPPNHNKPYLVRRIAYRIQECYYGGLSESTQEELRRIARGDEARRQKGKRADAPVVGTRFLREWEGERHEVTVVHGGFEYRGKCYRSLTAAARAITGGGKWNGWVFFGLRKNRKTKG